MMTKAKRWASDYLTRSSDDRDIIQKYDLKVDGGDSVLAAMFEKFAEEVLASVAQLAQQVTCNHSFTCSNQVAGSNESRNRRHALRFIDICRIALGPKGGNVKPCPIANEKTGHRYYCTRDQGHKGPCAAVCRETMITAVGPSPKRCSAGSNPASPAIVHEAACNDACGPHCTDPVPGTRESGTPATPANHFFIGECLATGFTPPDPVWNETTQPENTDLWGV